MSYIVCSLFVFVYMCDEMNCKNKLETSFYDKVKVILNVERILTLTETYVYEGNSSVFLDLLKELFVCIYNFQEVLYIQQLI
jgi:hypothetical protein